MCAFGKWEVIEVIPGWKLDNHSTDIFIVRNIENPAKVVKYEVVECANHLIALEIVRNFNAHHKSPHRLTEFTQGDKNHKSGFIVEAALAFVDEYKDGFHSATAAIGNLAFRLNSIGDENCDLDELEDLLPHHFSNLALDAGPENNARISLGLSQTAGKWNQALQLLPKVENMKTGAYWLLFISSNGAGRFDRKGRNIFFTPVPEPGIERIELRVCCFDGRLRKKLSEPVFLDLAGTS